MTNIWGERLRTTGRPTAAAQTTAAQAMMRLGNNKGWDVLSTNLIPAATAAAGEDWG
ncbi:hypothetical protein [Frankia sp. AgKG'84/4]|uniref:hypothetical protein n=1 Tax=Frankia sp. AgKG'84/4 TaxID=573490 RepID=UPI00200F2FB2|nr:hypothetical protein [Frankia sp. AgKG'84/4]MCL9794974.1 hypothetical protein [Frankia sp. AgKG'84/4]